MDTERNQELLFCRACLVTDCKLFNIHEYKLADTFALISGTPVCKDGLPEFLCTFCHSLVRKCASFRRMCVKTQQLLAPELLKGEFNIDSNCRIHLSHRLFNLNITPVKTIDYIDAIPDEEIKREPAADIVEPEIDITIEPNSDIDHINIPKVDIIEPDIYMTDTDEPNIDIVNINNIIKEAGLKAEGDINVKDTRKRKISTTVKKELEIDDINVKTSKNIRRNTRVSKRKTGVEKVKIESGEKYKEKCDDAKPASKKKRERPNKRLMNLAKDYLPASEFSKFESTYAVKIVTLNKQEQLEEIAARKQSANYLESRFKCEDCGRGFDMGHAYNNHRMRHSPSAGSHACDVCAAHFKYQNQLKQHLDQHKMKFVCSECGFVSRSRCQAKCHHAVHSGKTFECQHCGKTYSKRSSYLSHVRLSHPAMNVACDQCGETFVGQAGLKHHKGRMHSEKVKPEHFKCTTCPAKFVSLDALNRHTDTGEHSGSPCEQCGESCASEEALQAHVGERHPKETHRCEECRASFSSAAAYDVHYKRKHLGERCVRYSVEQYREVARKRPRSTKRTPIAGQFVCEQCGRTSATAALLRIHQRMHLDVKPFACDHCPKTFATNALRSWHARTHTGEKPYQCPECPFASSQKSNLVRHHKSTHLGIHANAKCPICERVCTTRSGLRIHINSVHYGQPWPKRDRARKKSVASK